MLFLNHLKPKGFVKLVLFFFILASLNSCMSYKKIRYIQKPETSNDPLKYINERKSKIIQSFDELYINVLSIDEQTAAIFNAQTKNMYGGNSMNLISYLVDERGNITFPFVGEINLMGLTLHEAKDIIEKRLMSYIPNISVTVKFVNNSISVFGEVKREGNFEFSQDKISLFQAVAMAGGLSDFGNRRKVTLVRESNNTIEYHHFDLTQKDIVESPYYYLISGDVIVVEPLRMKAFTYRNVVYADLLSTITTLIAVIYAIQR